MINHDQSRPDHAYSMTLGSELSGSGSNDVADGREEEEVAELPIPCVMVSWNSGQAILDDQPERLRLYPGGGRPFIESVSEESPVVFLIHNLLSEEESNDIKQAAAGHLRPSVDADDDARVKYKSAERSFDLAVLDHGILKSATHKAVDEKLVSIINFPAEYFAPLEVNRFGEGGAHGPHYDSDKVPSVYREKVMTVVLCLDSVPEGGGGDIVFPRARLLVRPQAGMAIVFHNTAEDGSLDMKSLHAHEALVAGTTKWTATQRIYATKVPLAARTLIPAIATLSGGEAPSWVHRYRDWAMVAYGDDFGYELFNYSFIALAALALLAFIAGAISLVKLAAPPPLKAKAS